MDRQQFMQQAALRLITGGSSMSPEEVYNYTKELGELFFPVEKASKPDKTVETKFHPGNIICYMYRSIIFCDSIQDDCVTSRFEYDMKNVALEFTEDGSAWQELNWNTNGTDWKQKFNVITARVHFADPSILTGDVNHRSMSIFVEMREFHVFS